MGPSWELCEGAGLASFLRPPGVAGVDRMPAGGRTAGPEPLWVKQEAYWGRTGKAWGTGALGPAQLCCTAVDRSPPQRITPQLLVHGQNQAGL